MEALPEDGCEIGTDVLNQRTESRTCTARSVRPPSSSTTPSVEPPELAVGTLRAPPERGWESIGAKRGRGVPLPEAVVERLSEPARILILSRGTDERPFTSGAGCSRPVTRQTASGQNP
jgi:hypothetical protein